MKNGNLKLNTSQDFTGWISRTVKALPKTFKKEGDSVMVEAVITTEAPAIVADWERWEMVREILLMKGVVLPETKQVTLLNTHSRYSTEDIRGSIRELRVEGYALIGDVHFWSKAEDDISLVKEGHLTDLSAGYKTFEEHTIEVGKGAQADVDGRIIKNDFEDGLRLLIRTKWELKEGSLVPIGADKAAKFRSELQTNPTLDLFGNVIGKIDEPGIKSDDPKLQLEINKVFEKEINDLKTKNEKLTITINERNDTMPENKDLTPEEIRKADRKRVEGLKGVTEMLVVKKLYKGGALELEMKLGEAINSDLSVGEFQEHCYSNLKNEDIVEKSPMDLDMSKKEISKLSISRALNAMVEVRDGDPNGWDKFKAGAEQEAIAEATKRAGKIRGLKLRGSPLPLDFFKNPDVMRHSNVLKAAYKNHLENFGEKFGVRATDGLTTADMQYVIATEVWAQEFIDVLRNLGVAGPWGVRMISGAQGNISVPKKTSPGTFSWVAERGTGAATDFVIGQLTASPNSGWASMTYGRQANLQSIPALDALVIDDILNNVITGRDLALLHGTGSSNQPTGITAASGIGDVVGASLDWEAIVEFWTDVKTNNVNSDTLRFVMNALVAGLTMTRPVVSGQSQMLWDRIGQISAAPIISQQVAANNLIYGDGSEAWMIDWGLIDLQINPFLDTTGDVTITVFTLMDILISRVKAFTLADDVN